MKIKFKDSNSITYIKDFFSESKIIKLIPRHENFLLNMPKSDCFVSEPIVELANIVKPRLNFNENYMGFHSANTEFSNNQLLTFACRDDKNKVQPKLLIEAKKIYSIPVLKDTLLPGSWIDGSRDANSNKLSLNTLKVINEIHENKKITSAYDSMNILNLCLDKNQHLNLKKLRITKNLLKNDYIDGYIDLKSAMTSVSNINGTINNDLYKALKKILTHPKIKYSNDLILGNKNAFTLINCCRNTNGSFDKTFHDILQELLNNRKISDSIEITDAIESFLDIKECKNAIKNANLFLKNKNVTNYTNALCFAETERYLTNVKQDEYISYMQNLLNQNKFSNEDIFEIMTHCQDKNYITDFNKFKNAIKILELKKESGNNIEIKELPSIYKAISGIKNKS